MTEEEYREEWTRAQQNTEDAYAQYHAWTQQLMLATDPKEIERLQGYVNEASDYYATMVEQQRRMIDARRTKEDTMNQLWQVFFSGITVGILLSTAIVWWLQR